MALLAVCTVGVFLASVLKIVSDICGLQYRSQMSDPSYLPTGTHSGYTMVFCVPAWDLLLGLLLARGALVGLLVDISGTCRD